MTAVLQTRRPTEKAQTIQNALKRGLTQLQIVQATGISASRVQRVAVLAGRPQSHDYGVLSA